MKRSLGALAAVVAAPVLAGCERPVPAVTLAADAGSVRTTAAAWCWGPAGPCVDRPSDVPGLPVRAGDWLLVAVDPDVVERGWRVLLDGVPQPPVTGTTTLELVAPRVAPGGRVEVVVEALGGPGGGPSGRWALQLLPR
ncbi:hypothetical protein [Vallicoccus soli]|uniref:DUF2771 family protein n=1 Tax=Vallicoccus soli TaxID=2339232 RepID=A0A3A3Z2D8_9ACTN|nr:hypothetical protein [Vallicoccus soli]RJK97604.1 hypothetical protein D5H78_00790 [Vallicoccus soli]